MLQRLGEGASGPCKNSSNTESLLHFRSILLSYPTMPTGGVLQLPPACSWRASAAQLFAVPNTEPGMCNNVLLQNECSCSFLRLTRKYYEP